MHEKRPIRVYVYKNVNNGSFSVRDLRTGSVIGHSDRLLLKDAVFRVSQKGRLRVVETGQKNVHAGIVGELVLDGDRMADAVGGLVRRVFYKPHDNETFVDASGSPVLSADLVLVSKRGVYVGGLDDTD